MYRNSIKTSLDSCRINKTSRIFTSYEISVITLAIGLAVTAPVQAMKIDAGNRDIKIRWDNTLKYSGAYRVEDTSSALIDCGPACTNQDDGDRNFGKGIISNRLDILSEADIVYKNVGVRVSGAAWYDSVYNKDTDNDSPQTYNVFSNPYSDFSNETEELHGQKVELLDAFLFAKGKLGGKRVSGRLGRHSQLYGESLFFGNNGIANAQSPIDVVKALSVPSTQFKEIIRPVNQLSGQVQFSSDMSLSAYYQLEWEKTILPASGSYFSNIDILSDGGERLIAGAPIVDGGGPAAFFRGDDIEADDSGQFGIQLRYRADSLDTDFGFYAMNYHDKTPQIYIRPSAGAPNVQTGQIGDYVLVYPEDIRMYGISASRTFGRTNWAGEISYRENTPLTSNAQTIVPGHLADNNKNPAYAVGESLHAQVSILATLPSSFIANEASLIAEIAWHIRQSIDKNPDALDPGADKEGLGIRLLYEPTYRQVLPGLDLSVPIGVSYFPKGNSSVLTNFGPDKGGDISIGVSGLLDQVWRMGLNYTHFYGNEDPLLNGENLYSYGQTMKDRNFISFTASRTF